MTLPAPARRPDLERLARLLDAAVAIPGTNFRIGLDAVLGLVPGAGDLVGAALSGYIVLAAARAGAPPLLLLMMLLNVAIDTFGGAIPLLGDLFDAGFRSNMRNVALLERHLAAPVATRRASWVISASVVITLIVLLAFGVTVAVLSVRALVRLAQ